MSDDIEPLPCPFCGKSNQDRWPCNWLDGSGANVIRCAWCHGAAPMIVWNRRANVEASTEALRAEVRTLVRQNGDWQARAERLAEALRKVDEQLGDVECESAADARAVERCHDIILAAIAKAVGP